VAADECEDEEERERARASCTDRSSTRSVGPALRLEAEAGPEAGLSYGPKKAELYSCIAFAPCPCTLTRREKGAARTLGATADPLLAASCRVRDCSDPLGGAMASGVNATKTGLGEDE
jgi:hypothetical protein